MRRYVGRHADGDARRAVHQQGGQGGREDDGFGGGLLVVGHEVHCVAVDVHQEVFGDFGELALRVPVRGGAVALYGAEVALRHHERIAHDPVLRQARQGVVNGRVPVRVVVFEDFTHDARALVERAVVQKPLAQHGVEHAPLDGFEAVAHVGEGAGNDDGHRVVDVRALHYLGNARIYYCFVFGVHCAEILSVRCRDRTR